MWSASSCHVPEEEAGGTAGAAANLLPPLMERRREELRNELTRQVPLAVSCCLASRSPGSLAPAHSNSSLHKQPQFTSKLSCSFSSYLSAAVFPGLMKKYFVNCKKLFKVEL